jgi:hypothetical protein
MVESRAFDNEISRVQRLRKSHACTVSPQPMLWSSDIRESGADMEFTALFLAIAIVMLAAWRGSRPLALGLFALVIAASLATYLHHATDTLKLSF